MPRPSKLADAALDSEGSLSPRNAGTTTRQARRGRQKAPPEMVIDKPVALTVKVDQPRYEALKVLGARTRRSNQEILLAALDAYLRNAEEGGASNVRPAGGQLA